MRELNYFGNIQKTWPKRNFRIKSIVGEKSFWRRKGNFLKVKEKNMYGVRCNHLGFFERRNRINISKDEI